MPSSEGPTDRVWRRHENPKSGWSRFLVGPLLLVALYRRDRRLLVAAVAWSALNPVVFAADGDDDAWMTRVVRGERAWIEDGHPLFGTDFPAVLNVCNVPVFAYAAYAAWTRRPVRTTLSYLLSVTLKLGFVASVARYYERTRLREGPVGEGTA